jgi:polyhydroxyalkanoate synthesis regulator phasin
MPVDVAELAKRVSQLQIEDGLVDELRAKVNDLEQRIEDLEAQ